jgi:hypothetical protein
MSTRRSELDQSRRYGVVHGECWYRSEQDGKKFDHQGLEILTDEVGEDAAKHQPRRNDAAVSQMPRSSAAERMRRTRERRRAGIIAVVSVEIRQQDLDKLVARNLISPEETDDREKIATAIRRALENWHQT